MQIWIFLPLGSHLWQKKGGSGLHTDQNFQGRMCHKRGFIASPLHPIPSGWSQHGNFGDDPPFLWHWLGMVRRKGRIILTGKQGLWYEMKIEYVCLHHLTGVSHCQRIMENKFPFRKKSELPSPPSHEALLTGQADRHFVIGINFLPQRLWRLGLWIGSWWVILHSWSTYEWKQHSEGCFKLYCILKEISGLDVLIRNPRRDHKKSASGGQAWTIGVPGLTKK